MSKSKKRRTNSSAAVKQRAKETALADQKDRDRTRMNPTARALLLVNLIFLAVSQLLYTSGMLSEFMASLTLILGLILMLFAIYLQFGGSSKKSTRLK